MASVAWPSRKTGLPRPRELGLATTVTWLHTTKPSLYSASSGAYNEYDEAVLPRVLNDASDLARNQSNCR